MRKIRYLFVLLGIALVGCGRGDAQNGVEDYAPPTPPPEIVETTTPSPEPEPLRRWMLPQYINPQLQDAVSNEHLAGDLQTLHDNVLYMTRNDFPRNLWMNWSAENNPAFDEQDAYFDMRIRQALRDGFAHDTFRYVLPFNEAYWNSVIDAIIYHVWLWRIDDPALAMWSIQEHHGEMHILMHVVGEPQPYPNDRRFVNSTIHEVANIFGLGDSLSELLAEELMARPSIVAHGQVRINPDFDRVLLEKAGPIEFWRAAFTSNAEMKNLWDEHLGHIISASKMQMLRGIDYAQWMFPYFQERLWSDFYTGHVSDFTLSAIWFAAAFENTFAQSQRDEYLQFFLDIVTPFYDWGRQNHINPYPFVHDGRMSLREGIMSR